jgi:hypothetical protein
MSEHLLGVALDHVPVELSTSKFDRRTLQGLLLRRQFKIHAIIRSHEALSNSGAMRVTILSRTSLASSHGAASHLNTPELLVINLVRRSFRQRLKIAEVVGNHIERQILGTEFL